MAYRIIVFPTAEADLEQLDGAIRKQVLRRMVWLSENASQLVHHHLTNMPDDLAGLCRFRIGDYRMLYWPFPQNELLKIYRVQHRREVYRNL